MAIQNENLDIFDCFDSPGSSGSKSLMVLRDAMRSRKDFPSIVDPFSISCLGGNADKNVCLGVTKPRETSHLWIIGIISNALDTNATMAKMNTLLLF